MSETEFKADHFKNIEELIENCKMWINDDDYDAYCRFFDMGAMEELIKELDKEKEKNKELEKRLEEIELQILEDENY